jgi:oligopeptide/dipeptide ABC transporter ATP-binding protein
MDPEFIVLDEPVSNLDVSIQAQIINLLQGLREKFRLTYLFISHDLHLVAYLADRIGVMYRGRLVESAPTDQLMARPLHPYTQRLFASAPGAALDGRSPPEAAGEAPTLAPGGCTYRGTCERAASECGQAVPELRDMGGGRRVACFRVTASVSPGTDPAPAIEENRGGEK